MQVHFDISRFQACFVVGERWFRHGARRLRAAGQALCWPIGRQLRFQRHGGHQHSVSGRGGTVDMTTDRPHYQRPSYDHRGMGLTYAGSSDRNACADTAPNGVSSDPGWLPTLLITLNSPGLVVGIQITRRKTLAARPSGLRRVPILFPRATSGLFDPQWPNLKMVVA
jgi:hypothetical protein